MKKKLWICCMFMALMFIVGTTEVKAAKADDEWNYERDEKFTVGAFTYSTVTSLDENEIWIYNVKVDRSNPEYKILDIPELLDGKKVTRIGLGSVLKKPISYEVCDECYCGTLLGGCLCYPDGNGSVAGWIDKITLPETVEIIETAAFAGMRNIKSIAIPSKVTVIDEGVFKNCSNLKTVTIPDSLTEINAMAFEGCYKIKTINQSAQYEIKDKCVIRKKDHALVYVLPQKGKLKIPNGVKTIQRYAFCTCTSSEVTIPASVTHIEDYAFQFIEQQLNCAMKKITVAKKNRVYGSDGQCVYNKKEKTLVAAVADNKGEIVISDKVEYLKEGYSLINFDKWGISGGSLKKVVLPKKLKKIDAYALGLDAGLGASEKVYFTGAKPPKVKKKKGYKNVSLPTHVYVSSDSFASYKKWLNKWVKKRDRKYTILYKY